MDSRKRSTALLVGIVLVAVGTWGAVRWQVAMRRASEPETVLPDFDELGPGPRAPATGALAVRVGFTTVAEVEALAKDRGIRCEDTSIRAMMKRRREAREAAKARGEEVDATTSATPKKGKSKRALNPQVRLSCVGVRSDELGDRARAQALGRWLFVFDSPDHPLRHVSYRRKHVRPRAALVDLLDARDAMKGIFGEPMSTPDALPELTPKGRSVDFPRLKPLRFGWRWADLEVQVQAIHFGRRGVDILESVEVPWPVRADAPALPAKPAMAAGG